MCPVSLDSGLKSLKMTVLWDFAPCSLVEIGQRFQRCLLPHHRPEVVSTSETSVIFSQTIRRNIPEDSHLHTRRRENLKSHLCQ
jgi:hypothetical protein